MLTDIQKARIYSAYNILVSTNVASYPVLSLTPLADLTNEHALVLCSLFDTHVGAAGIAFVKQRLAEWSAGAYEGELHRFDVPSAVFQFLTLNGYEVPLFIEPSHPDNGSTAVELKLAKLKKK